MNCKTWNINSIYFFLDNETLIQVEQKFGYQTMQIIN